MYERSYARNNYREKPPRSHWMTISRRVSSSRMWLHDSGAYRNIVELADQLPLAAGLGSVRSVLDAAGGVQLG